MFFLSNCRKTYMDERMNYYCFFPLPWTSLDTLGHPCIRENSSNSHIVVVSKASRAYSIVALVVSDITQIINIVYKYNAWTRKKKQIKEKKKKENLFYILEKSDFPWLCNWLLINKNPNTLNHGISCYNVLWLLLLWWWTNSIKKLNVVNKTTYQYG